MEKQELINFERAIADSFNKKEISSPIHFSGGNEDQLIGIFQEIRPQDWIFTTYRNHYHALLKGVPKDWLVEWIKNNRSIHLMNSDYRIVSSAIVAGHLPQAVGMALAIQRKGLDEKVWAFCGDMAAETGTFHECYKYATRQGLPITFVVEDNGVSTNTPTQETWGKRCSGSSNLIRFNYSRTFPHYGTVENPWNRGEEKKAGAF
ncbi:hypothetical protein J4423_02120 [Candidatus Pacearchaeota archaeon]|nr:hypothetical protein [Candidatus Pacearchaeota archaeon]